MEHTPSVVSDEFGTTRGLVLIRLKRCPICGSFMVDSKLKHLSTDGAADMALQVVRAGWHYESDVRVGGEPICERCKIEGKATVRCALCGEQRSSKQIKESYGYPPEYLCRACYVSVPAAVWEAKVDELEEAHRWDFE